MKLNAAIFEFKFAHIDINLLKTIEATYLSQILLTFFSLLCFEMFFNNISVYLRFSKRYHETLLQRTLVIH